MSYSFKPTPFQQVIRFHRDILHEAPIQKPTLPSDADQGKLMIFLFEEIFELQSAFVKGDLVGAADALADIIYFAYGGAVAMGLPFDKIWETVHQANMRKAYGVNKRGLVGDAVKPNGWVDPKDLIKELLK